jgi:hypothetical protein
MCIQIFAGQKFCQAQLKFGGKFFRQCSNGHMPSMYRTKISVIKFSPTRAGGEIGLAKISTYMI